MTHMQFTNFTFGLDVFEFSEGRNLTKTELKSLILICRMVDGGLRAINGIEYEAEASHLMKKWMSIECNNF